ncbi:hypothetical protein ABW19_dt0208021 [Dactylella cylindrospora]|nr:hypothetical protein ABW19_dt0208021 [Dactylella cylindrospora]
MPDTTAVPPPSGICDNPSANGGSSLATSTSHIAVTSNSNISSKKSTEDINGSTDENTLKQPLRVDLAGINGDCKGETDTDPTTENFGSSETGGGNGSVVQNGPAAIPNPSTTTSPSTPSTPNSSILKSNQESGSIPTSPVIQEDKTFNGNSDSPTVTPSANSGGGTIPLSSGTTKKEEARVATSYYSTLALRQIKNLSNAKLPPSLTTIEGPQSKNPDNTNSSSSNKENNSSGTFTNHPNRASISLSSGNPLWSLANLARAVSGSTGSSHNTGSTSASPNLSRRKTLSSRRQSDGALLKSQSADNLERLGRGEFQSGLTLEEVLETTGNHSQAVALDPARSLPPNMHQSSSRLLRMTQDDRPFTRDFKDLFSTLVVSLPLTPHRLRFKTYYYTFTSSDAVNNLGSLKFSQSNRMPDPKDPSRIVTTTTTTTFSMAKEMARTVCQKFVAARFMEAVGEKSSTPFSTKNMLWQLTPKGIHVLERFCQRNGINAPHVMSLLSSPLNTMRLVILERDPVTDKISQDRPTTEIIFRRFAGPTPNLNKSTTVSDSDSISEYAESTTGVRIAETRKVFDKVIKYSLTGKNTVDWLLDCCTSIDPVETHEIAAQFVRFNLLQCVIDDKIYTQSAPKAKEFQPTKNAIYIITERGKRVAGWIDSERGSIENGKPREGHQNGFSNSRGRREAGDNRETNTTRLSSILSDPALRLLFREFLRETLCEENLSFWIDVQDFQLQFKNLNEKTLENIRETLASAYGIYNAYLAPGSPCELNIDHTLRQDLAARMTRAVAKDEQSMYSSLKEVAILFERAQEQVFKLMAGDSVPKFAKTARYIEMSGDNGSDDGSLHGTPPPEHTRLRFAK